MKQWLLIVAIWLVAAPAARAYTLSLDARTPTTGVVGDIVSFDLFLDTEREPGLVGFSVGITFDPTVVRYRPDLSEANDYYPLYERCGGSGYPWDPGVTSCKAPRSGLMPVSNPPRLFDEPPDGRGQVNVEFRDPGLQGTVATASDLWMASLAFELVAPGVSDGDFGFAHGSDFLNDFNDAYPDWVPRFTTNMFIVDDHDSRSRRDVSDEVTLLGSPLMTVVPEPSTLVLVGVGLVAIGAAGRRRR